MELKLNDPLITEKNGLNFKQILTLNSAQSRSLLKKDNNKMHITVYKMFWIQ